MPKDMKIPGSFYQRDDVVKIASELLGKYLFTCVNGELTGGLIIETEAYAGVTDRASHAWNGRRTARTEVMYDEGGVAYIYLCYGIHSLFNIVTNKKGIPHAVLIRGIYPTHGLNAMFYRIGGERPLEAIGTGPGRVSKILGLHFSLSGTSLIGNEIWLEDRGLHINHEDVRVSPRVGVEYAKEDASLPYRFLLDKLSMFKK
jgi:DNA-3-methyladenine glycosylase